MEIESNFRAFKKQNEILIRMIFFETFENVCKSLVPALITTCLSLIKTELILSILYRIVKYKRVYSFNSVYFK